MFGPTYETRNKQYDMDTNMREILYWYWLEDRDKFLIAFAEGLKAERIWEVETSGSRHHQTGEEYVNR
jgi:hypothetical protein